MIYTIQIELSTLSFLTRKLETVTYCCWFKLWYLYKMVTQKWVRTEVANSVI